jgi:hypothetical protein
MTIGLAMVAVSVGLFTVRGWARWGAIAFATINAITQVSVITAFPIWALVVIALDVIVIYQLTTHWYSES